MNKKIALGFLSIVGALTIMGGSAFAAFATSADLKSNTFSTTTPNLEVSTDNVTYSNQVTSNISEGGIVPGGTPVDHVFFLKNSDTDSAATVTITGQFTITSGGSPYTDDLSVDIVCDNGANTGYQPISTWASTPQPMKTLAPGAATTCHMTASLPNSNTTDAGQSVTFDAVFGGSVGS